MNRKRNLSKEIELAALNEYLKEDCKGIENLVTSEFLRSLGFGTPAEIRHNVHELRVQGNPICSCHDGYWYANNKMELLATYDFVKSYYNKIEEVLKALEAMSEDWRD